MKMLSTYVVATIVTLSVLAQEPAPQAKSDADSRIEALVTRMAELEAEVARLRAERPEAPGEDPKDAEGERTLVPIKKPSRMTAEAEKGAEQQRTGFRCRGCGGSFFLSADASGRVADLGEFVLCPACGTPCRPRLTPAPTR